MNDGQNDLLGPAPSLPAVERPVERLPAVERPVERRGGVREGGGRPKGALNHVNRDLRGYLVGVTGREAILEQYKLAAVRVTEDEAEIERLAKLWKCSRIEVVDRVGKAGDRVFSHIYPKLGSLEFKRPGAPGNPLEADDLFGTDGFVFNGPPVLDGEWSDATEDDLPDEQ